MKTIFEIGSSLRSMRVVNMLIVFVILILLLTQVVPTKHQEWVFYINPIFRLADFILGIGLFSVYKNFCKKLTIISHPSVLEVYSVLLLCLFFALHKYVPDLYRYSIYYWIPMSCIIVIFSYQRGVLSKFLSLKPLVHLGEISFSFYLIHQLIILKFVAFNQGYLQIANSFLLIGLLFFITIFLSHILFTYFEKPLSKYIKNVLIRRPANENNLNDSMVCKRLVSVKI